jgi:integrase
VLVASARNTPPSPTRHLRLQENGRSISKSLRTTDKSEAEILALPFIAEHKRRLMALRPRLDAAAWFSRYQPGKLHTLDDGSRFLATERELHHLDADGNVIRRGPNGGLSQEIVNVPKPAMLHNLSNPKMLADVRRDFPHWKGPVIDVNALDRPTVATKNDDDALFEAYLKHKNVSGYGEREVRHLWSLFKTLTDGKPLKDCTRDDGRKLVAHLEAQGLKSASVRRKINWLRAACNFGIDEKKLTFNPFSKVAPRRDDSIERMPLDDADMAEANRNLDKLRDADQLLFRVLATTGMRLSEAFQIDSEKIEGGCRFVIIGKKTAQSKRRVPFPTDLLRHLPEKIKGPLFKGATNDASKRLNTWLNDIGITDPAKVVHSLRHRAQDRLRAAECPEDIRWSLLGHEKKTVAAGYGKGFPVPVLRKWIDKIAL